MKYALYAIIGMLTLSACQPKPVEKEKPLEEIDSTMQAQVQTLLKDKMEETLAYAGQVLVMDAATGKMRVCAGWLRTKEGTYQEAPKCMDRYPLYYMRSAAFLAAMQTGKVKLTDTVDVGNGIYVRGFPERTARLGRRQTHDHPTDAGLLQAGSHGWRDCHKGKLGKHTSGHVFVHGRGLWKTCPL